MRRPAQAPATPASIPTPSPGASWAGGCRSRYAPTWPSMRSRWASSLDARTTTPTSSTHSDRSAAAEVQGVVATPTYWTDFRSSSSASAGVFHFARSRVECENEGVEITAPVSRQVGGLWKVFATTVHWWPCCLRVAEDFADRRSRGTVPVSMFNCACWATPTLISGGSDCPNCAGSARICSARPQGRRGASMTSSSPRSATSTGSTTAGCTVRPPRTTPTSPRQNSKRPTTVKCKPPPRRPPNNLTSHGTRGGSIQVTRTIRACSGSRQTKATLVPMTRKAGPTKVENKWEDNARGWLELKRSNKISEILARDLLKDSKFVGEYHPGACCRRRRRCSSVTE